MTTELLQRELLTIRPSRSNSRNHCETRAVYTDEYRLPDDAEAEDIEGQEGFVFSRTIPVPQSLRECVQTFDALDIKIRHHLAFTVQLHNPDGHVSELHANLPVFIFLSPNLPIDDNNNLISGNRQRMATAASELADLTPPQYGEHEFDRLYSDIDPSGYMTPAGAQSGVNTPFNSRSRSVSAENLLSMDAMASGDFAASALQNRLISLDVAGPASSHRTARGGPQSSSLGDSPFEQNASRAGTSLTDTSHAGGSFVEPAENPAEQTPSGPISRHASDEDGAERTLPQHIEYRAKDLARVPSYTTALQSNPRTPISQGLPTYQAATRPSMPGMRMPLPPCQAYRRSDSRASSGS